MGRDTPWGRCSAYPRGFAYWTRCDSAPEGLPAGARPDSGPARPGGARDPARTDEWPSRTSRHTGVVMETVILAVVIAVVVLGALGGLIVGSRRKRTLPPAPPTTPDITAPPAEPHIGDEAETPRDEERRTIEEVDLPDGSAPVAVEEPPVAEAPPIEIPEPTAGRLVRLRARLSRSQNALGQGLLMLLSRE